LQSIQPEAAVVIAVLIDSLLFLRLQVFVPKIVLIMASNKSTRLFNCLLSIVVARSAPLPAMLCCKLPHQLSSLCTASRGISFMHVRRASL
jgi:hypothetical protein